MESFKEEFILNASHEFKTPLSTIKGYATLLKKRRAALRDMQYLDYILELRKRLTTLTAIFWSCLSLIARDLGLARITFDPSEQIRQCIFKFGEQMEPKKI